MLSLLINNDKNIRQNTKHCIGQLLLKNELMTMENMSRLLGTVEILLHFKLLSDLHHRITFSL